MLQKQDDLWTICNIESDDTSFNEGCDTDRRTQVHVKAISNQSVGYDMSKYPVFLKLERKWENNIFVILKI